MKVGWIYLYKVSIFVVVSLLAIILRKDRTRPKMAGRPRWMISKVSEGNRPVLANVSGIFPVNLVVAKFLPIVLILLPVRIEGMARSQTRFVVIKYVFVPAHGHESSIVAQSRLVASQISVEKEILVHFVLCHCCYHTPMIKLE